MPNGRTGDFDAVLQVSGSTLNRLAATMHQNGFTDSDLPSLPHIAYFRTGDRGEVPGQRGSFAAQIGVPRITLIDGSRDRVRLTFGFRARYRADPGTKPLADIVHGKIRATYRWARVDRECPGWEQIADDYIWLQVEPPSVTFDGSAYEDDLVAPIGVRRERVRADIGRHVAALLAGPYAPKPHSITPEFRRMITLNRSGGSAVAVPLTVDGSAAEGGKRRSISRVFLSGHDFAVAVSSDYIVQLVQEQVDSVAGWWYQHRHSEDAGIGGGLVIDYRVEIDSVTTEWLGGFGVTSPLTPFGVLKITAHGSGRCPYLYMSGVFDWGIDVEARDLRVEATIAQSLSIQFDVPTKRFVVSAAGDPSVDFTGPGVWLAVAYAKDMIVEKARSLLATRIKDAQDLLDTIDVEQQKSVLVKEMRSIDGSANATFDDVSFDRDGIVLRGRVRLSHRRAPRVSFKKDDTGGFFDAIESWIPGGRVDSFHWTWRWFTNLIERPSTVAGSSSHIHSFYLERPIRRRPKFGFMAGGESPLPGLDGWGEVCLVVNGVSVDAVTGALVPVHTTARCSTFGYAVKMPPELGPYLRTFDPLLDGRVGRSSEIGLMRSSVAPDAGPTSNSLVVFMGADWDGEAAEAITEALKQCDRTDAGLIVVALFIDGAFDTLAGSDAAEKMQHFRTKVTAPVLITEDTRGSWKRWLALDTTESTEWRLVDPAGVISWVGNNAVDWRDLVRTLDTRLVSSQPAAMAEIGAPEFVGQLFPLDFTDGDCPAPPLARPGTIGTRVLFADTGAASAEVIRRLRTDIGNSPQPPCVGVVVDNASSEAAHALKAEYGLEIEFFGDPAGELLRQVGVSFTPAMYVLDARGRVVDIQTTALSRPSAYTRSSQTERT